MSVWRTGRSVGRTLYRDDVLVGLMDTPELAAEVVAALRAVGRLLDGDERPPDTVRCATCGDDVRPGRFDSYGQHPRTGLAELCPGPKPEAVR